MEFLNNVGMEGQVGRFRPEQIAQRSTWARIPDSDVASFAMHSIRVIPDNNSTVSHVNPLDPASIGAGFFDREPWNPDTDTPLDRLFPAGKSW